MSTSKGNYSKMATSDTSSAPKSSKSETTNSSAGRNEERKGRFVKYMKKAWNWWKKSAWVVWVHFGVMFFKVSIFLSIFYTPRQLDTNDAITLATCFAFMDFVIHSVFNHQHLMFNLTAGVAVSLRKLIMGPLDGSGKDAYGNDTSSVRSRLGTFLRDMMNMGALVFASYLAALFNITVVFPRKPDEEDWKFISHTRDGLGSSEVFGIAFVGFFFLAWMQKQMHYRIQTDIPVTAKGVSCDIDCALNNNQSALYASVSFVSAFWIFVSLHAPNNMGISLGPAIVSGDTSNLRCLFMAEILAWFSLEFAFSLYAFYNHHHRKKESSLGRLDTNSSNGTDSTSPTSPTSLMLSKLQGRASGHGDHHHHAYNPVHLTRY